MKTLGPRTGAPSSRFNRPRLGAVTRGRASGRPRAALQRWAVYTVFLAALATAPGCVMWRSDGERIEQEIQALKKAKMDLDDQITIESKRLENTRQEADARIAEIQNLLKQAQTHSNVRVADLADKTDKLEELARDLKGQNEVLGHRLEALEAQVALLMQRVEGRLPEAGAPAPGGAAAEPAPQTPPEYLRQGRKLINDRQCDRALAVSAYMLKKWPEHALAADAQLLGGDAYLCQRNYVQAIAAYDAVIKKYPKSDLIPQAYFQIGMCFFSLGKTQEGCAAMAVIRDQHGQSQAAARAKARMEKTCAGK